MILENKDFEVEVNRVRNAVNDKIDRLREVNLDWAYWDDTYEFVDNKNEEYIRSNIAPSTFYDLKMEYLLIFDDNNNIILNYEYDKSNNSIKLGSWKIANIVKDIKNDTGLIIIDGQAIAISTNEITDTNKIRKPKGLIVFGYKFDQRVINNIESQLELDIEFENDTNVKYVNGINIERKDIHSIATFQIPYFNMDKMMTIKVKMLNNISLLGRKTVRHFILFVSLTLITLVILLYLSLNKVIIKRLNKLSEDTYKVINNQDISKRLNIDGKDEITDLKDDINIMLDKIEVMNNEITRHASYDVLTEVYNRRVGLEILREQMIIAKEKNTSLTIAFIDVNNLKIVNDSNNHQMGDQLLIDVVNILKESIRNTDEICRLGGDEFLLILPKTNYDEAEIIFKRIEKLIMGFNEERIRPYDIEISKGIIEFDKKMSIDEFIDLADEYMYIEKKAKKEAATTRDN